MEQQALTHAAVIEQFLETVFWLEKKDANGASVSAIAQTARLSVGQVREIGAALAERGLLQWDASDVWRLSTSGVRRLLSESVEDYVVTIYRQSRGQNKQRVSTSAIAQALGVAAPSVTSMIQNKLAKFELVDYERHHGVTLTPLGERIALQILRHHRIVELYLTQELGLPWDQVHDEAHRLEHAMSPMLVERLAAMLGDPQVDPHGDPIPALDGTVERGDFAPLYDAAPGQMVVVRRIRDQSAEVLRYLGTLHLLPGTLVQIVSRAPLNGPLTVRVADKEQVLGRELACVVLVSPSGQ
jgi:DtxR family Mn-dependent transcriptional regulator